ncbi:hypothetical protein NM208_g14296 [Fusarium decemcellulare]|uniref:Uncharacterized protein n=1 Tax=Fusarium decemcellulare TaxID=57161 RepID=A0ACC1RGM6_9HYPO|nr:hypothetical protein NM208_g14296 [Fusarium decemcellulare]
MGAQWCGDPLLGEGSLSVARRGQQNLVQERQFLGANDTGELRRGTLRVSKGNADSFDNSKILTDTIHGITKPAIRIDMVMALLIEGQIADDESLDDLRAEGGVKRISANIYDEARKALKAYLEQVIQKCVIYVEHRNAKTVTIYDVIHSLRQSGRPIYGFDPDSFNPKKPTPPLRIR